VIAGLNSQKFQDWIKRMNGIPESEMSLNCLKVQSVDMFGKNVGFIKFVADVKDVDGKPVPGIVFMRGPSVAVLMVINNTHTVLVQTKSVPTGTLSMPCLPAGMMDSEGNFASNMAREIKEETGLEIAQDNLFDLTHAMYGEAWPGVAASLGGSDEWFRLFLAKFSLSDEELNELNGKKTGLEEEGEQLTVCVIPLRELIKVSPDSKVLCAYSLYRELKEENKC
jgi:ADP-sugar diphosphatase